jgi:polygalacturonase
LGAPSFYDYAPEEKIDYPAYQDSSHTYYHCSMFVGIDCENIRFTGGGRIDMRSVWDEDNVRRIVHRGPKCIALKYCKNVEVSNLTINNVTDLAVYFSGCENVDVFALNMRVYIDGVSPDNSKNVRIHDCDIEAGDDAIVFKSSYTLNKIDICKDIHVWNCRLKSLCNALKFGTETNGGFENILIEDIEIRDTRITGISVESVDGAVIDGVTIRNIKMQNVNAPIFVHVGRRMRGPQGRELGWIRNLTLENITAEGPYEPYEIVAWNYFSYKDNDTRQNDNLRKMMLAPVRHIKQIAFEFPHKCHKIPPFRVLAAVNSP